MSQFGSIFLHNGWGSQVEVSIMAHNAVMMVYSGYVRHNMAISQYLDNVLGCQVEVSVMTHNAGVLATQLHLNGNHARLQPHALLNVMCSHSEYRLKSRPCT